MACAKPSQPLTASSGVGTKAETIASGSSHTECGKLDYGRNCTTYLATPPDIATGKVEGRMVKRHRDNEINDRVPAVFEPETAIMATSASNAVAGIYRKSSRKMPDPAVCNFQHESTSAIRISFARSNAKNGILFRE